MHLASIRLALSVVAITAASSCSGEVSQTPRDAATDVQPDALADGVDATCDAPSVSCTYVWNDPPYGDGRTYTRCISDADCLEPARPHCSVQGIFDGYDWNCNPGKPVRLCRAKATDDCPDACPRSPPVVDAPCDAGRCELVSCARHAMYECGLSRVWAVTYDCR